MNVSYTYAMASRVNQRVRRISKSVVLAAAMAVGALYAPLASAQLALPDTGVDVAGLVTLAITALGAILVTIVGGYFAFLLIKKAMRWGGRAFG